MLRNLPLPIRCLPLCTLFLLMAAEPDCTIHIDDGDDDPSDPAQCADLADVCPDLQCDAYAVNDNNCPICECDTTPPQGCANDSDCGSGQACVQYEECGCGVTPDGREDAMCDPAACTLIGVCEDIGSGACSLIDCGPGFVCEESPDGGAQCIAVGTGCRSDADCAAGERCDAQGNGQEPAPCDPSGNNCDVAPPPPPDGVCVPVEVVGCFSDADCADGFICDLSGTIGPNTPIVAQNPGVCVAAAPVACFADTDCAQGYFCDFGFGPPAPIAQPADGVCRPLDGGLTCANVLCEVGTTCVDGPDGPQCVGVATSCTSDQDCAAGEHCEFFAGDRPACDPTTPDCAAPPPPPVDGQCVPNLTECEALCGPGSACVVFPDGSVACDPIVPPPAAECVSDSDCGPDLRCNASEICLRDPNCVADAQGLVACTDVCWGQCVPPAPVTCQSDADCGAGQTCVQLDVCNAIGCAPDDPSCAVPCIVQSICQ